MQPINIFIFLLFAGTCNAVSLSVVNQFTLPKMLLLCIGMLVISSYTLCSQRGTEIRLSRLFLVSLAVTCTTMLLATLFSENGFIAVHGYDGRWYGLLTVLLLTLFALLVAASGVSADVIAFSAAAALVPSAILSLASHAGFKPFGNDLGLRVFGLIGNPITFAGSLGMLLPFLAYVAVSDCSRRRRAAALGFLVVYALLLILSASRGQMVATFVSGSVFAVLYALQAGIHKRRVVISVVLLLGLFSLVYHNLVIDV